MNQLYVYIYPHIPSLPHLPHTLQMPPLYVVTKLWADILVLCSCFTLTIYFTFISVYMYMLVSHFIQVYPSQYPCPQGHSLCLCLYTCPTPRFIRTIFFIFHIYVWAYSICFSLSDLLHSVWQNLSPSTSLQQTQFSFFYDWVIFHCIYVPQHLYPFICQWTPKWLPHPGYSK